MASSVWDGVGLQILLSGVRLPSWPLPVGDSLKRVANAGPVRCSYPSSLSKTSTPVWRSGSSTTNSVEISRRLVPTINRC